MSLMTLKHLDPKKILKPVNGNCGATLAGEHSNDSVQTDSCSLYIALYVSALQRVRACSFEGVFVHALQYIDNDTVGNIYMVGAD